MRCVIHQKADGTQRRLELNGLPLSVGRLSDAAIAVDDPAVSRHHCVIGTINNQFFVRDHSSTNGTLCNGQPVTVCTIESGDKIQVGNTTLLFKVDSRTGTAIVREAHPWFSLSARKARAAASATNADRPEVRGAARRLEAFIEVNPWRPNAEIQPMDKQLCTIPGVETIRLKRKPEPNS